MPHEIRPPIFQRLRPAGNIATRHPLKPPPRTVENSQDPPQNRFCELLENEFRNLLIINGYITMPIVL